MFAFDNSQLPEPERHQERESQGWSCLSLQEAALLSGFAGLHDAGFLSLSIACFHKQTSLQSV